MRVASLKVSSSDLGGDGHLHVCLAVFPARPLLQAGSLNSNKDFLSCSNTRGYVEVCGLQKISPINTFTRIPGEQEYMKEKLPAASFSSTPCNATFNFVLDCCRKCSAANRFCFLK